MPNLESEVEDMVKAGKPEEEIKAVIEGAGPVIYGCTDPTSLNHNPKATDDDGSCEYEKTEKEDIKPTLLETKKEVIEEDPYEAFYVKPSFFGEATEDGGTKNKPSEEEAVKELNEKLGGLGIKVIEDKAGFNAIKIIGGEGEEDIDLGLWKGFMTFDDETPTEKADRLNGLINDVIKYKQEENPLFNIDTYVGAMQKAKADKPEVYSYSKDGGRFLTVEELNFEQLNDHTHRVHLNLMNDYFKSDEGKANIKIINEQKICLEKRIVLRYQNNI